MAQHEVLKRLRVESGKTAKQVAESCGIPYNVYLGYESGKRVLGVTPIVKLADYYHVSADVILERDVNKGLSETIGRIHELSAQILELSDGISKSLGSDSEQSIE